MYASRATDTQLDHNIPGHGYETDGPATRTNDCIAALVCERLASGYRAVTVLHGGSDLDFDDALSTYQTKKRINFLMNSGPIYHLGGELTGYRWRPNRHHKDDSQKLISLSKHRRHIPKENLRFASLAEMAEHARAKNIHHAYLWTPYQKNPADPYNPETPVRPAPEPPPAWKTTPRPDWTPDPALDPDPRAPEPDLNDGIWNYIRTMPRRLAVLYLFQDTLDSINAILEAVYDPHEYSLFHHYEEHPDTPGCEVLLEPYRHEQNPVYLLIDDQGIGRALILQPLKEPVPDRDGHNAITTLLPLTAEESRMLTANIRTTLERDRAEALIYQAEEDALNLQKQAQSELQSARLEQIRSARKELSISQRALSKLSGVSIERIHSIEHYGSTTRTYMALAPHLGIDDTALITNPQVPASIRGRET